MSLQVIRSLVLGCLFSVVNPVPANSATVRKVKVEDLLREADVVGVVRILSGDTEGYEPTVYKAEVLRAIKGTRGNSTIYFGPYDTYGVGSEYLIFVKKSARGLKVKHAPAIYGRVPEFYEIMYAGFSAMAVEYACVFGGVEHCAYGIKLNPEQVLLPKEINSYPEGHADARTNYEKWVYKDVLLKFLVNTNALTRY